jgi:hypothetical protein
METVHSDDAKRALLESSSLLMPVQKSTSESGARDPIVP